MAFRFLMIHSLATFWLLIGLKLFDLHMMTICQFFLFLIGQKGLIHPFCHLHFCPHPWSLLFLGHGSWFRGNDQVRFPPDTFRFMRSVEENCLRKYFSWTGFYGFKRVCKVKTINNRFVSLSPSFNPFSIIYIDQFI